MSSITPVILEICREYCSISPIAPTASRTTVPEAAASSRALSTSALALAAPSADERTEAVSWSSAEAVCSRVAA